MNKELVEKALAFAREKHRGQKYGELPFITHPLEVFEVINLLFPTDFRLQAAALLHDVLEDTPTKYTDLSKAFGEDVADLVFQVTKTEYNTFPNLHTQRGVVLKFADRLCNIGHLEGWDEERKNKYLFEKSKFWK